MWPWVASSSPAPERKAPMPEDTANLLVSKPQEKVQELSMAATTPTNVRSPPHWSPIASSSGTRTPKAGTFHGTSPSPGRFGTPRRSPLRMFSPGTPMGKALHSMKTYLEDIGHLTKLDPKDAWLPITASRTGNAYYSAFHNLNAGIGFQALLLPLAFTFLGWTWGVIALVTAFVWQLYTLWLLIQLHEAVPGKRCSRYMDLAQEAFGPRVGKWLTIFPVANLSAGTGTSLIVFGGGALQLFFTTICSSVGCSGNPHPLTTVEWYLVFAVLCWILAQLPNLNSIAGVSLFGALTAIAYTTMVWGLSVSMPRPPGISYDKVKPSYTIGSMFSILNALGIVAFAFRGHNLVLEIQGTMPSSLKHPSRVPMWRGAIGGYLIIALCLFPIAILGYWSYGKMMLPSGILFTMVALHPDISKGWMATTLLLVVLNCLSSFQIYSMPMFDLFEHGYTSKNNKPCPMHVRHSFRTFFVFLGFFIAVAAPFISSFAGLLGGLTSIPVTFCLPCFMWLRIKKPDQWTPSWCLNWTLGVLGVLCTIAFTAGGIWSIVDNGIKFNFFKP